MKHVVVAVEEPGHTVLVDQIRGDGLAMLAPPSSLPFTVNSILQNDGLGWPGLLKQPH